MELLIVVAVAVVVEFNTIQLLIQEVATADQVLSLFVTQILSLCQHQLLVHQLRM
jgi:hypothetical protein